MVRAFETMASNITELQSMFPDLDRDVLAAVLDGVNGNGGHLIRSIYMYIYVLVIYMFVYPYFIYMLRPL